MILDFFIFVVLFLLSTLSIIYIEEKLKLNLHAKLKKFVMLIFVLVFCSCSFYIITTHIKEKLEFKTTGIFLNSTTVSKLFGVNNIPYRLFPDEKTDLKDPLFYKKPGIRAIIVDEKSDWVIKFIDPFMKDNTGIITASVIETFINKQSHGKIFGTELNVDIYVLYNKSTDSYDKLEAYLGNERTELYSNDYLLKCSLIKSLKNDLNIIAKGPCMKPPLSLK